MLSLASSPVLSPLTISQILVVRLVLWFSSFFVDFDKATWDDDVVSGLDFIANSVLQVPFFLMTLMRYITPTMDHMYGLRADLDSWKLTYTGLWTH